MSVEQAIPILQTQKMHRTWLLRLIVPFGGRYSRLLSAAIILAFTWLLLGLINDELSRYEQLFFASLFAYSIAIFSRIVEQSQNAVDELQESMEIPADLLAPIRRYMASNTSKELFYMLAGALFFGTLHATLIRLAYDTPLTGVFSQPDVYAAQLGTLTSWVVLTAAISSLINNAIVWARLGSGLEIDLLQPRAAYTIGRIAVLSTLSIIGAQVLFVILILDSGWDWVSVFPGLAASFIPTLALFFIPVWPLHTRLREQKKAALAKLEQKIRPLGNFSELALENSEAVDQLNRLLQLRREIQAASVWPFDAPNLVRIILYLLLPPLTWVGAALVENMVGSIVG
jgi:hypothetical protein